MREGWARAYMHLQMKISRIREEKFSRPQKDVATVLPSNLKNITPSLSFPPFHLTSSIVRWAHD